MSAIARFANQCPYVTGRCMLPASLDPTRVQDMLLDSPLGSCGVQEPAALNDRPSSLSPWHGIQGMLRSRKGGKHGVPPSAPWKLPRRSGSAQNRVADPGPCMCNNKVSQRQK